ncbi:maleylpyruvate isomerase family mycothiol-dependent enzyme [Ruania halotolerans]|uniref:maleylpyruvate isomerase family mycothiol-dependent enzyme n=1 Tax=Ruania halotolerans TaxID=2897773 RepID=UPI001E6037BB|nr:maleylpyruvate isomerase family mycothiol-dependent enzyme [Ruania halotolerans]UFU06334.1 maleylpyruvate isomerase family mycothiol-dependent enzyme [Ruania halotolerans]
MTTPETTPAHDISTDPQTEPAAVAPFSTHLPAFTRVVESTTNWDAPSPCEGWSAADVLDHVIDSQRDFLAERVGPVGERPTGSPVLRWQEHHDRVAALVTEAARATTFEGYLGPTSVAEALDLFYSMDLLVHRWDIARADGRAEAFTDAELDQIEAAARVGGAALRMEGICKAPVPIAQEAPRQHQVLAFLGRDPR